MSKKTLFKLTIVILLGILGFSLISLNAQVVIKKKKDELTKKVEDIKGEVKKITVETGEGTTVFEGEEAEKLMKRMKGKSMSAYAYEGMDGEIDVELDNIVFIGEDDMEKEFDIMVMSGDEGEWTIKGDSTKNIKEKLEVKKENGELKVTLTTFKDGEETVKTYTGDEAKEFLESRKEGDSFLLFIGEDDDVFSIKEGAWIEEDDIDGEKVFKIKINKKDGEKNVEKIIIKKQKKEGEEE